MFLFAALILVFIFCLYKYFTIRFDYFKQQGIDGPSPVPVFGNFYNAWNKQWQNVLIENQKKYGKVYGIFAGRVPNFVIADPEILRRILVKDFDCFTNRQDVVFNNEYLNKNVGSLRDEEWKKVRGSMSIAFTSGKIKKLYEQMESCANEMVDHLKTICPQGPVEINAKKISVTFSLDVISSCGLGMKIPNIRDPNDPFVNRGMKVVVGEATVFENFMFTLTSLYPSLAKLVPSSAFSELDFFVEASKRIINSKKCQDNTDNVDLLGLLFQSSKQESSPFKNEDFLFAQVLVFLLAGFDTVATTMAHILHCLSVNPEVQERLRQDILEAKAVHKGITYDCYQNIPYLEQCIFEGLRLYPANIKTERECGETITINNIRIDKGTIVTIPTYAMHHDPQTFPNPEIFDPERFSNEAKMKRDPLAYLPFGYGPRGCLGQRLAMEELKLGLSHLLSNFKFTPSRNTKNPLQFLDGLFVFNALVARDLSICVEKI